MRKVSLWFAAVALGASVAPAAAQDTKRPGRPTNLTVAGVSSTQVNLSWTNSTDNIGVTEYALEGCLGASCTDFAQLGTSTGVTFPVVALTANSSYRLRVRARDAAGNWSPYFKYGHSLDRAHADVRRPERDQLRAGWQLHVSAAGSGNVQ